MQYLNNIISTPALIAIIVILILIIVANTLLKMDGKIEYPYVKANLLTKNELAFFNELRRAAAKKNMHVLAKVRMADVVAVKKGTSGKKYQSAFNRVSQKHFDFVLINPISAECICVVELDDSSHDKAKATKNDTFKNKALETVKLPLIRTRTATNLDTLINEALSPTK